MSVASDEAPGLGLDPETTRAISTASLAIASLLRERRQAANRLAWSRPEAAARHHDLHQAVADPRVRAMDDAERAAWEQARPDTRRVDGPTGSVTVAVADLGDRWGLYAEGAALAGERGVTYVSCLDEATAKQIADRLLAAGPASVTELDGFAAQAAERAAIARAAAGETEEQRLARAAATLADVWGDEVAAAVTRSEAFGALAWRLHELEELGIAMPDALGRINGTRLLQPDVRDPAALGEYMLELELARELQRLENRQPGAHRGGDRHRPGSRATAASRDGQRAQRQPPRPGEASGMVIDLDSETELDAAIRRGAGHPAGNADPAKAAEAAAREAAAREQAAQREAAQRRAVVEPMLVEALADTPEVLDALQRSADGYESLLRHVHDLHASGRSVEQLLSRLPVDRIAAADEPALYLRGVLRRRDEQRRSPHSGVDEAALKNLVRTQTPDGEGLPDEVADTIIDCVAWPWLAKRLAHWEHDGWPVGEMLARLPVASINDARKPAAWVATRLEAEIARKRDRDRVAVGAGRGSARSRIREPIAQTRDQRLAPDPTAAADHGGNDEIPDRAPIVRSTLEDTADPTSEARRRRDQRQPPDGERVSPPEAAAGRTSGTSGHEPAPVRAGTGGRAAASARAAAAEDGGAPTAAAHRADVSYAQNDEHTDPAPPAPRPCPRPAPATPPVPAAIPSPHPQRGRGR